MALSRFALQRRPSTAARRAFSAHVQSSDDDLTQQGFVLYSAATSRAGSTLVESMLSIHERSPTVLTREFNTAKGPVRLCIGAATDLSKKRPGNGGFRMLAYDSNEAMTEECVGLAQGMEIKHAVFNTGFSGAKVVADASKLEKGVSSLDPSLKSVLMEETSELLKSLKGTMFTGCDMNTTLDDMSYLAVRMRLGLETHPCSFSVPTYASSLTFHTIHHSPHIG